MVAGTFVVAGCGDRWVDVKEPVMLAQMGEVIPVGTAGGITIAPGDGPSTALRTPPFLWDRFVGDGEQDGFVSMAEGVVLLIPDAVWGDVVEVSVQATSGAKEGEEVTVLAASGSQSRRGVKEVPMVRGSSQESGVRSGAVSAGIRYVACSALRKRPSGYSGPDVSSEAVLEPVVVGEGASWWRYGRRNALDYVSLSALNGIEFQTVKAGKGLIRGRVVWLVVRRGESRRGRFAFCASSPELASAPDTVWRIFPEQRGREWRAPAEPPMMYGESAPALLDHRARWIERPGTRSWAEHAKAYGLTVSALMIYNGVKPGQAVVELAPVGDVAVPVE